MGWASAGDIFDPIAQTLIDLQAPEGLTEILLTDLIARLRSEDWDTCDESLDHFRHFPVIVLAFAANDIFLDEEED